MHEEGVKNSRFEKCFWHIKLKTTFSCFLPFEKCQKLSYIFLVFFIGMMIRIFQLFILFHAIWKCKTWNIIFKRDTTLVFSILFCLGTSSPWCKRGILTILKLIRIFDLVIQCSHMKISEQEPTMDLGDNRSFQNKIHHMKISEIPHLQII